MPTAEWPIETGPGSVLGEPLSMTPLPEVLTSTVDAGRPKTRALRRKHDWQISGTVVMTDAEKDQFDEWFADEILGGAMSFEWVNPASGEVREFRFINPPKAALECGGAPGYWRVSLEIRMYAGALA